MSNPSFICSTIFSGTRSEDFLALTPEPQGRGASGNAALLPGGSPRVRVAHHCVRVIQRGQRACSG